ncbi:unnamed protein product (mitochondrion) [Plasmodiophora brassicae]|uniref:Uncharacterized protein n=1 Tax=Plasmodiophora brassicae TaxID=37360 RepID=A0A3P3YAC0_PLABS|nr:unnamed protein product [Plasmodiophora brassicae]
MHPTTFQSIRSGKWNDDENRRLQLTVYTQTSRAIGQAPRDTMFTASEPLSGEVMNLWRPLGARDARCGPSRDTTLPAYSPSTYGIWPRITPKTKCIAFTWSSSSIDVDVLFGTFKVRHALPGRFRPAT